RYPEKYKLSDIKPLISFGASPRGSINLALAAKCYAFIKRRGYVIPEDVRAVVHDVLRHRIGITYEAEADNVTSVDIINKIVNEIEVRQRRWQWPVAVSGSLGALNGQHPLIRDRRLRPQRADYGIGPEELRKRGRKGESKAGRL